MDLILPEALLAVRQPADAVRVGLIAVLAPANKPPHKGATMYQPQVAEADFIGMLLPVLAVPAVRLHRQAAALHQLQLRPAQVAAHVRQDIIGCLIMAVGVCLTVQQTVAQPTPQLQHLLLLHQHQLHLLPVNLLRLKQQVQQPNLLLLQLHLVQLNRVPLRLPQANPSLPLPILNGG